jgi:hypothetical protein
MALFSLFSLVLIALLPSLCFAADPYAFYDLRVSYITASPLGVPQQVHFLTLSHSIYWSFFSCGYDLVSLKTVKKGYA